MLFIKLYNIKLAIFFVYNIYVYKISKKKKKDLNETII